MVIKVISARVVTHQLAKTYQPNMVLNQCVSIDITQSQAAMEEVTAKIIKNTADSFLILYQEAVPPSKSS